MSFREIRIARDGGLKGLTLLVYAPDLLVRLPEVELRHEAPWV